MKAIILGCTVFGASLAVADNPDPPVPLEAIVELLPGANIDNFHSRYNTSTIAAIPNRSIYHIQLPSQWTEQFIDQLAFSDPEVLEADLNYATDDPGGDTRSFYGARSTGEYHEQVQASAMRISEAHVLSTGSGVVVAVLDTGLDANHPEFSPGSTVPGLNCFTDTGDTSDVSGDGDTNGNGIPNEMVGHGTFVSGIIRLVAPDAQIMPIKVLDSDGQSTSFLVAKGIYHAIDQQVDVINLSLGTSADSDILKSAIREARYHWISIVAAAGNDGNDLNVPMFPAAYGNNRPVAVAATRWNGIMTSFSSYGPHITICSPGDDVVSTFPGGGFQAAEGTSFSTAWVTGAMALLQTIGWDSDPDHLARIIRDTGVDISIINPGYDPNELGGGLLDIKAALDEKIANPGCAADVNDDGILDPSDYSAWLLAFNTGDFVADQNKDKQLSPADFAAWIGNYSAGCL
ncbi:MAG TPA: hypothetical protein ENJ00_05520 [Phycisphaerales bacterium]|nr:hypothetical protein [Phycisphaerales bacterium]